MTSKKHEHQGDREYYFESYKDFAWRFRLWLVTYGAGLPVIFLSNKDLASKIIISEYGHSAVLYSMSGVGIQIIMAWVFKNCMWYCDRQAKGELSSESWKFKTAAWITDHYCIEIVLDLSTLLLYVYTTYLLISLVFQK